MMGVMVAASRAPAAPASQPSQPLAILARLEGEWAVEAGIKVAGKEEVQKAEGTAKFHWTLNNRFLQEEVEWTSGARDLYVYGYDTVKAEYRLWHFGSNGQFVEYKGIWDEKDHSMTWAAAPRNNVTAITKTKIREEEVDYTTTARGHDGTTLVEIAGVLKRKKAE